MKRFTIKSLMLVSVALLSINAFAGDGSKENPYTVAEAITKVNKDNTTSEWVKGYIVGGVTSDSNVTTVEKEGDIIFSATGVRPSAIVIADNKNETNLVNCFVIGFGSDSKSAKAALNLVDNADVLGKEVSLYGIIKGAFSFAGMKTIKDYILEGVTPPTPVDAIFSEDFKNGQGNFTIVNTNKPSELEFIWSYREDTNYGEYYMNASAYKDGTYASESYLISPAINLDGKSDVTFSFQHTMGPSITDGISDGFYKTYVSNDYSGDPATATWTELAITVWPSAKWKFVTNEVKVPAENLKANTYFAFKYSSSSTVSATWRVTDVKVIDNNSSAISSTEANTLSVYAADGVVYVPATAGQNIVVTNVAGQVVANVVAESEVAAINNLPANQVLLVKVGNQVAKVIR